MMGFWLAALYAMCLCAGSAAPFPCRQDAIAQYTAYRTAERIVVDGRLNEKCWQTVTRSPRFVDVLTGEPVLYDTRAAVLWDDANMYVAFCVEEPNVAARFREYGARIYEDNDVELFVAGRDSYYELELNALNTLYEVFFICEDSYGNGGVRSSAGIQPFPPECAALRWRGYQASARKTRRLLGVALPRAQDRGCRRWHDQ